MSRKIRLGVNIDHVATIRNARGGIHPSPVKAAILAEKFGADGITIHLREDRRHIRDEDLSTIKESINLPINLEMAPTLEMLEIALKTRPNAVCIVPEKRQEITTEGGLDVIKHIEILKPIIQKLRAEKIKVSLFVDACTNQIKASKDIGADIVEIHTGEFCNLFDKMNDVQKEIEKSSSAMQKNLAQNEEIVIKLQAEFVKIAKCAKFASEINLECHAGHGLNYETAKEIVKIPEIIELNIGHFLIGEAIFDGFEKVIGKMKNVIHEQNTLK